MEYKHTPPTLAELRALRKQAAEYLRNRPQSKKSTGLFGRKEPVEEDSSEADLAPIEMLQYELDVIIAHLENQNELLLNLARRIDKAQS